jgi:CRP/FNR family cyclic AMP-dependent transcriptional regulator
LVAALLVRAFPRLSDVTARLSAAVRDTLARADTPATEDAAGESGPAPTLSAREIASFLAESELFSKVDPEALRRLAEVTGIRSVAKGQTIFAQGDRGEQMFVLIEGAVRLVMRSPRGKVVELAHLLAPAAFGEVVLTDPGPRTATAEAVEGSVLLVLDGSDVFPLLRSDTNAMEALLRSQGAMVRRADRLAADLVFLTPQSRVAGALLDLAESGIGGGERPHTRRISDAELASIVVARPSQVTRVLRRFERLGYIRRVGQTIELLDPDELRHRAGR